MSTVKLSIPSEYGYDKIPRVVSETLASEMGFSPGRIADIKTAITEILIPIIAANYRDLAAYIPIEITFMIKTKVLIIKVIEQNPLPQIPVSQVIDQDLTPQIFVSPIVPLLADKIETSSTPGGSRVEMTFYIDHNQNTGGNE